MTELAHFLRDLDDQDDIFEKDSKKWTFVKEATAARQQFPTFFPQYAKEVSGQKAAEAVEVVQSLNDDTSLDSLLDTGNDASHKNTNFFAKFELSLYVHEVSKLLLHHKDVNKLYTGMKHEYLSFNNLKDDKLPTTTTAVGNGAAGPMDTTQHSNNVLNDVVSIAFDNTMFHLFPHYNTQYNIVKRPDFLYHHETHHTCYDIYVQHKEYIVQEIVQFHRDISPVLNDVFCYPNVPVSPSDAAAQVVPEKISKSFEEFTYGHAAIQELYKRIFVESDGTNKTNKMPPYALEMSQTFYHALLNNIRVVIYSLPRQRKTFAYNPLTSDLAKILPNDNSFPASVSVDGSTASTTQLRKEHDFDVVFVNSRHLFASARLYNTNANRLMKNAKDRDVYYDSQRYATRNVEMKDDNDATEDYLSYTREYNNTVLEEIELIQVSRRIPKTIPQYVRSCTIHFNENKKKNDVNTSTVLQDNTFLFSALFARYARENLNPTLYRNILTSKKLGLNYYTSDPYVVLGLYTLFMSEVMKYPSYLLIHAMILDLMDSSSNGSNSATSSLSSASGDVASKGLARPASMANTSFYGGSIAPTGPAKLTWLKLVPRKRLEGPVVVGGGEGVEKAPVERNEKVMQMLHDYMSKDVLIPIAIENYEEGNKELLALYNACTTLPYLYDDECKLSEHRPRNRKSTWEMKELLINKENQIMTEWFTYRCINYQAPLASSDPSQHAYYYQKSILPKFNELCIKWYGLSLYDTYEQLKL